MKALAVLAAEKLALCDVPDPRLQPHEILVQTSAVGLCGTDFHIYEGKANYNFDVNGRLIPLTEQPQILGHEFSGVVMEVGKDVRDLRVGQRVIVDQGINCSSRNLPRPQWCEYCASDFSHQCENYQELGITGAQGALADFVAVPAVNAIRIEGDLSMAEAALAEPLGCIIHATESALHAQARYTFGGTRPIKNILLCGAGPAGLLFTQYLRNVVGFTGLILVSEPNEMRRKLATQFGATAIDPTTEKLIPVVQELTKGERVQLLIDAAGVAQIYPQINGLLRKQGTLVMYGHGHNGMDLGVMNSVQFLEPTIIAPCGASGALDEAGKPVTATKAIELLSNQLISVTEFITNQFHNLESVPLAFTQDRFRPDFIKGVAVLNQ